MGARSLVIYAEGMKPLLKALDGVAWSKPDIMSGTIVFMGTRVPVVSLLDYLAGGEPIERFLEDFPSVKKDQVEGLLRRLSEFVSPEMYDVAAS